MYKHELRKLYKAKRLEQSPQLVAEKSKKIHNLLFSRLMIHRYSPIHVFLPILENAEPDTHLIINTLMKDFAPEIYISKSLPDGEMIHAQYVPGMQLLKSRWGIEEPNEDSDFLNSEQFFKKYENEDILVLVPLLIFDKKGHRVGYGKGYYDRFLKFANDNITTVGLSFFEPVDLIEDLHEFDFPLSYCITPERIWHW